MEVFIFKLRNDERTSVLDHSQRILSALFLLIGLSLISLISAERAAAFEITFQFDGTVSGDFDGGTLDGQNFTDETYRVVAVGDTDDRTSFGDGFSIVAQSATIEFPNFNGGTLLTIADPTSINVNNTNSAVTFGNERIFSDAIIQFGPAEYATWDLLSPIGPITVPDGFHQTPDAWMALEEGGGETRMTFVDGQAEVNFQATAACGDFAPTPIAPLSGNTTNNPTFSWTGHSGCEWYQVYVSDDDNNLVYQTWYTSAQTACDDDGDLACEIAPVSALASGKYTWWIQGWTSGSGATPWSAGNDFQVFGNSDCTTPLATLAPINASGNLPTYQWEGQSDCDWYQIYVNDSSNNLVYQTWYTAAQSACDDDDACEVTPTTALAAGDHTWWVRGYKDDVGSTQWSAGKVFTVSSSCDTAPTPLTPSDGTPSLTPTYSWSGNNACTWYQLYVNAGDSNVVSSWYTATDTNCDTDTSCNVIPITVLENQTTHTWWVRGWSDTNGVGPWSNDIDFFPDDGS